MYTRWLAVLIAVFVGQTVAHAQAPAIPPQIRSFEQYDENLATLLVKETYVAQLTVTVTMVNAAGVEEKKEVKVPEYRVAISKYLLAETTIRTVGGKELDRKVAAKEIKKGQPVILTTPFSKLTEEYKSLFRDDVIILEVKALGSRPDLDGVPPEAPK